MSTENLRYQLRIMVSMIRYNSVALDALEIDVNEICSVSPFSGDMSAESVYPELPSGLNEALDTSRIKTYLTNSLHPLMNLFGKKSMPDVDRLLTLFYQLDDEARKEVVETIQFKLQYHKDPERAEHIKRLKVGKNRFFKG